MLAIAQFTADELIWKVYRVAIAAFRISESSAPNEKRSHYMVVYTIACKM
ncbi:MAG: hypothetical protein V7L20_28545 [Nostoc sp.]